MKNLYSVLFILMLFHVKAQLSIATTSGIASYYAKKFEGRKCSSGEIFRQDSLTAAHKTLPFGTMVRVKNIKNDSVVLVRINDRLPKSSKRVIDLTRRAAKQLNFIQQGITKVGLEVILEKD
jgi:rare lipoprotein A